MVANLAIWSASSLHGLPACAFTQAVQLFNLNKYLQNILEIFNNPKSTYNEIESAGERFIITLYSNTKKEERRLNKMSNCTACSFPFLQNPEVVSQPLIA
ncbi:hypothetical protein AVEN_73712-1 [Araneus ventricosus]|uniref:Uncharacterized protein n=1 Tax=Araneus ventricosus TaxID=182803 RepID=A0A4Y2HQY9_ARAVE|nr:hypothetical protein AVEN_73712-1 [Araneus ventricosus]